MPFKVTNSRVASIILDGVSIGSQKQEVETIIEITDVTINASFSGVVHVKKIINGMQSGEGSYPFMYYPDEGDAFKQAESQLLMLEEFSGATLV